MIENLNTKKIISEDEKVCTGFFSKAVGLMFTRKPKSLIFVFERKRRVAITMMFVFYPLDLLFLDENKKVVELVKGLKPFKNYYPVRECNYVIELKKGSISKSNTSVGDVISF